LKMPLRPAKLLCTLFIKTFQDAAEISHSYYIHS
jgi:hypothetical protein